MRIEQEKLPSAEEIMIEQCGSNRFRFHNSEGIERTQFDVLYAITEYNRRKIEQIRYEYNQYQFFLEGYKNGSASISEVTEAHDRFLKLLET